MSIMKGPSRQFSSFIFQSLFWIFVASHHEDLAFFDNAETATLATTDEATTENHGECRIPAYASINYETVFSAPVTNDSLLVVKGQCYIACMELASASSAGFKVKTKHPITFGFLGLLVYTT